jgi:hypothetical protein
MCNFSSPTARLRDVTSPRTVVWSFLFLRRRTLERMPWVICGTPDWRADTSKRHKAVICQASIRDIPVWGFSASVCIGLLVNLSLVLKRTLIWQELFIFNFILIFKGAWKISTPLLKNILTLFYGLGLISMVSDCWAKGVGFPGGVGVYVVVTTPRQIPRRTHPLSIQGNTFQRLKLQKPATHIRAMLRLRMRRAISPLPHNSFYRKRRTLWLHFT